MKQHLRKTKRKLVKKTIKSSNIKPSFTKTRKMMKKGGRIVKVPNVFEYKCPSKNIKELDLSNCPNLTILVCYNNQITELDLSNCPNLTYLGCGKNRLTELDLSNCTLLKELYCNKNQITELDISQNHDLSSMKTTENPFHPTERKYIGNEFDYNIDFDIDQYRKWCIENYDYHNAVMLK